MNTGSNVYLTFHGLLRFGTITCKLKGKDGWAYFAVNWVHDELYEKNVKPFLKKDKYLYRADELTLVNMGRLSQVVSALEDSK
tara:strand:+ start:116 stop:364 length:249 start_codon:yes stop_codon:yes gene_type:complete